MGKLSMASSVLYMALAALAMASSIVEAAIVEHSFIVSEVRMTHLCNKTPVAVVNGQLPGPAIEVTEGDSVAVHVINKSPHNITIHWHGLKQRLNCWADGVPMVTQCPIRPGQNFTYHLDVTGQEGTLWWHAHVSCLRASLHGAFIIRPRLLAYPFPKPDKEIPIVIGEWWSMDLAQLAKNMEDGYYDDSSSATTINGKLGDLCNCSGLVEDGFVVDVEAGQTYLLRLVNAALYSEYYVKIAGHRFTVVGADANYVRPFTTDVVAIGPGETVDALVAADAPPGRYYMVAVGDQAPKPDIQIPETRSRAMVRYIGGSSNGDEAPPPLVAPEMPDKHDFMVSFNFHGNMSGLPRPGVPPVPARADESLFVALRMGSICRGGRQSCKRSGSKESIMVETMNNVSFQLPAGASATPLLVAHYRRRLRNGTADAGDGGVMDELYTLPDRPLRPFNFTDRVLIPWGPNEAWLEPTEKAAAARQLRHGAAVDVVFQNSAVMDIENHPMHLHGHDMFVLAQGHDNYDAARDAATYNLVDPPLKNTVIVPRLGWAAVRFVADNPGVWYMHCHYELHVTIGMAAVFIIDDGPTVDSALPPPPQDFPKCDQ